MNGSAQRYGTSLSSPPEQTRICFPLIFESRIWPRRACSFSDGFGLISEAPKRRPRGSHFWMLEIRAVGKSLLPRNSAPFDDLYVSSLESLARSVITPGWCQSSSWCQSPWSFREELAWKNMKGNIIESGLEKLYH